MTPHTKRTLDRDRPLPGRVALISDVHGNLQALEAVLEGIRATGVDEIWCLGDLVGYGAQPDECVALAAEMCEVCLAGNHDLVVVEEIPIERFSAHAAIAALWTREQISSETAEFLLSLRPSTEADQIGLYHGSPHDDVWEYLLSARDADRSFDEMRPPLGAIGHSHVALHFSRRDGEPVAMGPAPADLEQDLSAGRWIVNPGGVGQPRDGDPRAAWLLLDLGARTACWRRVEYAIDEAARAIQDAGLPSILSDRLYVGE